MKRVKSPAELRQMLKRYRSAGETIGFVPTMGDLHEGHLSLIRCAGRENDRVVVSIFVNPKQFSPKEDYKRYPRNPKRDTALARREKVDVLFFPSVRQMYPDGFETAVEVERLSRTLCGRQRPGHFRGVATVVAKLLQLVQPDRAYFGLKDFQQALVIQRMVRDLCFPVEVKFCPLIRDAYGLALSSRNRYLSVRNRARALALSRALNLGKRLIRSGMRRSAQVRKRMKQVLNGEVDRIDYVTIVNPKTLEDVHRISGKVLLAVAARVGRTRLIDNMLVHS